MVPEVYFFPEKVVVETLVNWKPLGVACGLYAYMRYYRSNEFWITKPQYSLNTIYISINIHINVLNKS